MTKWDKYLIVFVLIASLASLYYVRTMASNNGTLYAKIEVDGEEYKKISFGENMVGKIIEIKTDYGYNKIEIGKDKIRVIDADCPDKLDVKQGWISRPGEVIVCLPNKMIIEIISEKPEDTGIDHISY